MKHEEIVTTSHHLEFRGTASPLIYDSSVTVEYAAWSQTTQMIPLLLFVTTLARPAGMLFHNVRTKLLCQAFLLYSIGPDILSTRIFR